MSPNEVPYYAKREGKTMAKQEELIHPSLRGIRYVIFPDNKWAQQWDFVMILVIFYYAFSVPYQLGISGGMTAVTNTGFYVFNVIVNCIFVVDTFMNFFRAYRGSDGKLIFSLPAIRRSYIRSGWFFINLMAAFPSTVS
ncbi:hypothetical protein ACHAXS_003513 [Conticribra weissflogii]